MLYRTKGTEIPPDVHKEKLDHFRTNPPAAWRSSRDWLDEYEKIYGAWARFEVENYPYLVRENTDKVWVKPPYEEVPGEVREVEGGDIPSPGLSLGERMILEDIAKIKAKLGVS